MRYGYVRVSSTDQNEERQVKKMRDLGIEEQHIFIDKASGKNLERESYKKLMLIIKSGDEIVLDSLDRLGRDYDDLTVEWRRITREVGCDLKALDLEFFDSAMFRAMGDVGKCVEDMLLSLLAYVAQTERKKTRQRQAEGIALAKTRGVYKGGTRKTFDEDLISQVEVFLRDGGAKTKAADMLGVTRGTIYRMIDDGRLCDSTV
jgi:DNA invertase Pin-like site-specific DNA recombinase